MKRGPRKGKGNGEAKPEFGDGVQSLLDTLSQTGRAVSEGDAAVITAATSGPQSTLTHVRQVMKQWEESGACELFSNERRMAGFYKAALTGMFVRYVSLINRALELLADKLDDKNLTASQMLSIIEQLQTQIGMVKQQAASVFQPDEMPDSLEELDKRLAEAESRARTLQLEGPDSAPDKGKKD